MLENEELDLWGGLMIDTSDNDMLPTFLHDVWVLSAYYRHSFNSRLTFSSRNTSHDLPYFCSMIVIDLIP